MQGRPSLVTWVRRAALRPGAEDWLVGAYLTVLVGSVLAGTGPRWPLALAMTTALLGAYVVLQAMAHQHRVRTPGRELLRRLSLVFGLLGPFAVLQHILAAATRHNFDLALYQFDLAVFGIEPAVAWDKHVRPATTEWFSFFYFSYYFVILAFLAPFVFLARDRRLVQEFAFGFLFVFCVGQTAYLLVPGYGPHLLLASRFQNPLDGPFWWKLVAGAVSSGNARTDIFPSLHTAAPVFLTLLSFRHRRLPIFRFSWPITALFASQIVIATMFLRWHYVIDIVAGLALAVVARWVGQRVADPATHRRRGRWISQPKPAALSPLKTVTARIQFMTVASARRSRRERARSGTTSCS